MLVFIVKYVFFLHPKEEVLSASRDYVQTTLNNVFQYLLNWSHYNSVYIFFMGFLVYIYIYIYLETRPSTVFYIMPVIDKMMHFCSLANYLQI